MAEVVLAGNQFDIGIALQSARGVTVADADIQYRFPVTGGGVNAERVVNPIDETAQGRVRNTSFVGAINVDGAPTLAARPNILGLLLYGVFGAKAVTGAGDPYTHTFTLADTQPYFTLWKRLGPTAGGSGGYYEKYRDVKVVALTLASSAEGLLIATPTFMGLSVAADATPSTTPAIEAGSVVFAHHHGNGAMLVDGVNKSTISDFTVQIGASATRIRGNSLYGSYVAEQMRDIVIDTTQLVDFDLARLIMYGNASPADNAAPSGNVYELATGVDFKYTIPGQPQPRTLEFTAARCQVTMDPVDPNTDGSPIMANLHYAVYQPTDGSSAITAILQNGIASYAAAP